MNVSECVCGWLGVGGRIGFNFRTKENSQTKHTKSLQVFPFNLFFY